MNMVCRTADRDNVNLRVGRDGTHYGPEFLRLGNERQASLGAENAMGENNRIGMRHGRRYAAPVLSVSRARGLHPGLKSKPPLRGWFHVCIPAYPHRYKTLIAN